MYIYIAIYNDVNQTPPRKRHNDGLENMQFIAKIEVLVTFIGESL
jgi:hypothetical protein